MKHTKKYLAVLMAISILLCSIIAITSSAADSSQGESEAEIEELQPVMASGCHGTNEHQAAIDAFVAGHPNANPSFKNQAMTTAKLVGSWRPDAIVYDGGFIYIHEVVSPSQTIGEIEQKIRDMRDKNPGSNIIWSYQVIGGEVIIYH